MSDTHAPTKATPVCPDCGRRLEFGPPGQLLNARSIVRSVNAQNFPISEYLCLDCWEIANAAQQAAQNALAAAQMQAAGVPTLFEMEGV